MKCMLCKETLEKCICLTIVALQNKLPAKKPITYSSVLGKILASIFAVSCGMTNAKAFLVAGIMTGGGQFVIAGILAIVVFILNYSIFKKAVPNTLKKIFGGKKLFANILVDNKGNSLSAKKKAAIWIGLILSISAGMAFFALNLNCIVTLLTTITFLSSISVVFPPIGTVLALVTFICITSLMFDAISSIFQTTHIIQKCKSILYNLFSMNPELLQNQNKSINRIKFEKLMTLLFLIIFACVGILGLLMTMNACAPALNKCLLTIPNAVPSLVDIVGKIICFGTAFLAQLPFVFKNVILTIVTIFIPKAISRPINPIESTTWHNIHGMLFQIARFLSAIGNGFVAMLGISTVGIKISAGISAGFNTYMAGVDDAITINKNGSKNSVSHTKKICKDLKIIPILPKANPISTGSKAIKATVDNNNLTNNRHLSAITYQDPINNDRKIQLK